MSKNSKKESSDNTIESQRIVHKEENRLARRLFHLEQRVWELERKFDDLSDKIDFLAAMHVFGDDSDGEIRFCTCDEDED